MSEDPRKSLKLQKHTTDFERRLKKMEKQIRKLKATQRNLNNPSSEPTIIGSVAPDPATDHDVLLGLDDDDHPQYPLKTGWDLGLDETSVTIAMTDGTRTFTITPIVEGLQYYITGVRYEVRDPATVVIADTEGIWFIYYVGPTLTASQTPWDIAASDKAFVAIIYWDATNNASITIGWEFHSWVMDAATHEENHHTLGTRFRGGLAVADVGGGLTLNVTAGIIYDEDIKIDITDGAGSTLFEQVLSPAELPILYRDGAGGDWRKVAATTTPVILDANVLQLNELNGAWGLTNVGNNQYIAYWILATDDIAEPVISIPGQVEGATVVAVRDANPLSSMSFGDLPVAEYKVIARLIVQGLAGGNFYDIAAIDDFRDVSTEPGTGTTITDHSSLTGVTTSQHHVKYTDADANAVEFIQHQWFNPVMLSHRGSEGSMGSLTDMGALAGSQLVKSGANKNGWIEFNALLEDPKTTTLYINVWLYRDVASTDAITIRYYVSFLNDEESRGVYNLANNLTITPTLAVSSVNKETITITDADLAGKGILSIFLMFENLADDDNYLLGIEIISTADHASGGA